jgi:hypothetical protein
MYRSFFLRTREWGPLTAERAVYAFAISQHNGYLMSQLDELGGLPPVELSARGSALRLPKRKIDHTRTRSHRGSGVCQAASAMDLFLLREARKAASDD